jgi:hypothetical protein
MAGKNDFTATAGVSLEQWKKDIASMTADQARIAESADKAGEAIDKAAKKANTFGSAFKALARLL